MANFWNLEINWGKLDHNKIYPVGVYRRLWHRFVHTNQTVQRLSICFRCFYSYYGERDCFCMEHTNLNRRCCFVFPCSHSILSQGQRKSFVLGRYNYRSNICIKISNYYTSLGNLCCREYSCKKTQGYSKTILGATLVITIVIVAIYLKTGEFETSLPKNSALTVFLSSFYLINSVDIWGIAFLLVPISFSYKRTYADKFNYSFIAWFVVSMLFWSANSADHQYRFAIQFTPAVYFFAMLGIENFLRSLRSHRIIDRSGKNIT